MRLIPLTLIISVISLNAFDTDNISENNKNINNCIFIIKKQEIYINNFYSKNYKKFTLEDYKTYLNEKKKIFLKKSICYQLTIDKL